MHRAQCILHTEMFNTLHFIRAIFYGSIHSHLFAYAAKMVGHTIAIAIAPSSQRLLIDGADDVKLSTGTRRSVHSLSQTTLFLSLCVCVMKTRNRARNGNAFSFSGFNLNAISAVNSIYIKLMTFNWYFFVSEQINGC